AAPAITVWRTFRGGASGRAITEAFPVSASSFGTIRSGLETYASWPAVLQEWALPIWSLGVLLFSARLIFGYRHAFLLRRRGNPAGAAMIEIVRRLASVMGVRRPIRVLMSSMTDTPSVVGWLRPVILLPVAALMGLTPLQLEAILAHEI